jgi:predicted RND superfamily exporter protein
MLLLLRARHRKETPLHSPHFTSRIGVSMSGHKGVVLAVSMIILVVSVGLTSKSSVESNVLKFFPDDARINRDYTFIGTHLTGFYTVELDVTSDPKKGKELLRQITALGKIIEGRPEVAKVLHYGKTSPLLRDLAGSSFLPSAEVMRNNPFKQLSQHYVLKEENKLSLRMSVFIRAMSSREFYSLLDFIDQQTNQELGDFAQFKITGVVPLLNAAQQSLIDTQIRSFAIAVTVVLALIGIFMRSFRALVASVLPNILPIFGLFAMMVLLHISLDAATVMIATVAIGIAADDTIHFLSRYREERMLTETTADAIGASFQKVGRAITFTTIVAAAGFVILCLARFRPIQYFGFLASITMVTAWIGDVFVLPACVAGMKLWERK